MSYRFDWNRAKALRNKRKHGVSFEEAETVFADPLAGVGPDPDHSDEEQREMIVGRSNAGRTLPVSFTEREGVIRIISGRQLTRREQSFHEKAKH